MNLLQIVLVAALSFAAAPLSAKQPNILFIAVDDLRPELGCYGADSIKSPNIDRLARSGVTFERAYCQVAVCNPSRASVMTGLRPDTTHVWTLDVPFRLLNPDAVTLPQQLRKHGYYAVSYGKIFHNPWPDDQSWDEPHAWPKDSKLWSADAKQRLADFREKMRADGKSEKAIARMRPQATEIVDIPDSEHVDGAIAEQALAAMRRLANKDQPFFLAAGFIRPHLPFVVPKKYWELYDRAKIPFAADRRLPIGAPPYAMNTMYELRDYLDYADTADPRKGSLTGAQQRELKHGYYASVSFIDAQIGRLLDELERLELADDTVVVLWGDHGWKLGEHNSWCKQSNYEIDARAPLIIRSPGAAGNGKATPSLVEFVDIYPTLCDLAGVPVIKKAEGKSLAPILADPAASVKEAAISQFPRRDGKRLLMGYSMRTDRYRFVEWMGRKTRKRVAMELYDHENDPAEKRNLAGAGDQQDRLRALSRQLWRTIPKPPPFYSEIPRPRAGFENRRNESLTVYWLPEDGEPKQVGTVAPGRTLVEQSTHGHRFLMVGQDTGWGKTATVTRAKGLQRFIAEPQIRLDRPNIVVFMADDWSWPHAGICGDKTVKTPNFDRIAREGALFNHAFVSTPSCTPSRLSILTGQHHWRLKEGDSLGGSLREGFEVYTEVLEKRGYRVGRYGKGVWPSKHTFRKRDSFGERFKSLDDLLKTRAPTEPICFWYGGKDPHRPYELDAGKDSGIEPDSVEVPACLPDTGAVRGDLADYYWGVQRFDREIGEVLDRLTLTGELDNTIIVVSSDNGMPFPRCKATLYDLGTRVPLAIRWGKKIRPGTRIDDFVSLCDLAPTFLGAAGLTPDAQMTGRSLLPMLLSGRSGQVESGRTFVLTGMEKHVYPNPSRALRTKDFLYIRNFEPEKWETGEVGGHNPTYDFAAQPWPTEAGAFSFNIDPSPSKQSMRLDRDSAAAKRIFAVRPRDELYDLKSDPDQLHNIAGMAKHASDLERLRQQLATELTKSKDPRSE